MSKDEDRIFFLVSMPVSFKEKFLGFLKNLNIVNTNDDLPISMEGMYVKKKQEIVAIPKDVSKGD